MDKYSVVLDDEMTKTGGVGSTCPGCGKPLRQQNHCDSCGTEPFERRIPDRQVPVPQESQTPKK
jgi:rRNA maturation endonuclease Nob1